LVSTAVCVCSKNTTHLRWFLGNCICLVTVTHLVRQLVQLYTIRIVSFPLFGAAVCLQKLFGHWNVVRSRLQFWNYYIHCLPGLLAGVYCKNKKTINISFYKQYLFRKGGCLVDECCLARYVASGLYLKSGTWWNLKHNSWSMEFFLLQLALFVLWS